MPKLIFPQEIEVWYILPVIRKKIAQKLAEKSMPQHKIAELMGVTPAAISQYKKQKRAKEELFDTVLEKELEISVKTIIADQSSLYSEIIRLNEIVKKRGIICKIYQDICALNKSKNDCPYCKK